MTLHNVIYQNVLLQQDFMKFGIRMMKISCSHFSTAVYTGLPFQQQFLVFLAVHVTVHLVNPTTSYQKTVLHVTVSIGDTFLTCCQKIAVPVELSLHDNSASLVHVPDSSPLAKDCRVIYLLAVTPQDTHGGVLELGLYLGGLSQGTKWC